MKEDPVHCWTFYSTLSCVLDSDWIVIRNYQPLIAEKETKNISIAATKCKERLKIEQDCSKAVFKGGRQPPSIAAKVKWGKSSIFVIVPYLSKFAFLGKH